MRTLLPSLLLVAVACGPATGADSATPSGTPAGSTGPVELRILTWNVQGLGAPGSGDYEAVKAILARIDADVVGLNELEELENDDVRQLADELGYTTVQVPASNPFGDLHNAILAKGPATAPTTWRSDDLSGDPDANDITRLPVSVTVQGVRVVVNHCKSGFDDEDEFRRTVDAIRTAQAAGTSGRAVVMGDINQEVDEPQDTPATFTDFPFGMPDSYFLGEDLYTRMTGPGLGNGPFPHFADAGLTVVEAAQNDGELATRPSSGRRIDYILVGADLVPGVQGAEIYNARLDNPGEGLGKPGPKPDRTSSEFASDHFPVFVDLRL